MKYVITGHTRGIGKKCADLFTADGHEVIGFSRENGYDIRDPEQRKQILEQSVDADVFINNAAGYFLAKRSEVPEKQREDYNAVWDDEGYFPQTRMFMEIWKQFYNQKKTIVNVNSAIKYSSVNASAKIIVTEPREIPFLVTDETVWSDMPAIEANQIYFKSKEQLFAVASNLVGFGNAGGSKKISKTQFVIDANDKEHEMANLMCRCININPGWVDTEMFPHFANGRKLQPEDIAELIKWSINMPKNIEIFDLSVRKKLSNKEIGLSSKGKDFTSIPPIKA